MNMTLILLIFSCSQEAGVGGGTRNMLKIKTVLDV